MGRGQRIPQIVHLIIVRLSYILCKEKISVYTGIPLRSVERILSYFHEHQTVRDLVRKDIERPLPLRKILSNEDIGVSHSSFQYSENLYMMMVCIAPVWHHQRSP